MSEEHKEKAGRLDEAANQMIRQMCAKVPAAADWMLSIGEISTHWDHVVDGDPVDKGRFDGAMLALTVGWGLNEFYRQNSAVLSVVGLNAFLAWKSSDAVPSFRCKAYDVVTEIGTTVALLVGGPAHAIEWSTKLRAWALQQMAANDAVDAKLRAWEAQQVKATDAPDAKE